MIANTIEDSVASLKEWVVLRDEVAEWDKPESKFQIYVDSKGHCLPSGNQDDELQRFDGFARRAAIYFGDAELRRAAARDFLAVRLRDYFMGQTSLRQAVGLVGHDKEAIIALPFKAAKIYFGHLASDAPLAQRSNDESPAKVSEEQEPETTQPVTVEGIKTLLKACKGVIGKESLKEKRREVVGLWLKLRESITGKKATKTSLHKRADQPASEFFRWQRGELPHGSTPDIDIRSALTEEPTWEDPRDQEVLRDQEHSGDWKDPDDWEDPEDHPDDREDPHDIF